MSVYLTKYLYPCWLADGGCRHTSWNGAGSSSSTVIRAISIGGSALVCATVLIRCGILYGQSKVDMSSSEESLYSGTREYLQNNCKENDELTERKIKEI